MWIDPGNKDRFYLGNDKGLMLTHDHGSSFIFFDNLPIAQFYKVAVDHARSVRHLRRPAGQRLVGNHELHARRPRHPQRRRLEDALG